MFRNIRDSLPLPLVPVDGVTPVITTTTKRIGCGLLTAIAIGVAFDFLPNLVPASLVHVRLMGFFYFWSAVESAMVMFVAALAGAYVARVPFVVPAVILVAVSWSLTVYFSNSIAAAAGQGDLLAVAGSNLPSLILGGVGATLGAWYGHYHAKKCQVDPTTAA